ncbi:DUF3471 domain-containing protein [Xanthocytophaga agilis]|uniref:DUF3471 domain-containing protein n=1 Tax=Xanthocytophaga agilis TaxID=3048010 RepID=A0AAE3UFU4_9BACT|nr:DUF3471 domain-containing protein [Xanthocytophaga agilis]MDJ1501677.1 DUF3471 domain-containing protein [Xanthocytophaga agilis]
MRPTPNLLSIVIVTIFSGFSLNLRAQAGNEQEENKKLTATILHLDSLFWKTYNECNLTENTRYIAPNIQFYHDKGGITSGAAALTNSLAKNICGNPNQKIRREEVPGTIQVFPMRDGNRIYGAIISGEHYFYVSQNGKPERREGLANFMNLWTLENNEWKMSYILSYNHHEAPPINTRKEISLPAKTLKHYEGIYKNPTFGSFTIKSNGTYLTMKSSNSRMDIFAEKPNLFFSKERDLQFEFATDTKQKVSKIIVHENGKVVDELVKEE